MQALRNKLQGAPSQAVGSRRGRWTPARAQGKKSNTRTTVEYGNDWYRATREAARPVRTVREEIEYRRRANEAANNGKERKDLYTDNWDGSEYKGSRWNILTLLAALFFLVPVAGLVFAFWSYGVLWG